ncbi:MAG: hypothetical protein KC592_19225 [Nitrospira sp.]|nr:hypothetical protein [Nitrospira sp.]
MLSNLNMNPLYEAWVNSQETILRRLINRKCTVIQYRYFLVFLLIANRRNGKAREECERILNIYPNDLMARAVIDNFRMRARAHVPRKRHRRDQHIPRIKKCVRCFPDHE